MDALMWSLAASAGLLVGTPCLHDAVLGTLNARLPSRSRRVVVGRPRRSPVP